MPTQVAIAVVEHQGQFLVGQRDADVPLAGQAEFPGGKVQPGESIRAAAARECLEETGLLVRPQATIDVIVHPYEHATVELHFVECRLDASYANAKLAKPQRPFHWIARSSLTDLDFPAANARVIQRLVMS